MSFSKLKEQSKNYFTVLKWMLLSYYKQEKSSFWLIQTLMVVSVVSGLTWLLGLIAGLNHVNDNAYLLSFDVGILLDFFNLPIWVWLVVLSICGLLGAACLFLSFHLGVKSVIRFQFYLLFKLMHTINQEDDFSWLSVVKDEPKKKVNRILKTSLQLTGLVTRRMVRMLVPLLTFLIAVVSLFKLDSALLINLIPLALLYFVALYYVNRHAARTQVRLTGVSEKSNKQIGQIIDGLLHRTLKFGDTTKQTVIDSDYEDFSTLRYRRRLAEIHVVWINTVFVVVGSVLIVLDFAYQSTNETIDWMHLILFLVALRYASSSLQEMASATVSFSRFLPDTEMVYSLLHSTDEKKQLTIGHELVFYFNNTSFLETWIPQMLKVGYEAKHVVGIDEVNDALLEGETWFYSTKAIKFKQFVRKNKAKKALVITSVNGQVKQYSNIDEFLDVFNPALMHDTNESDDFDDELI